MSHVNVMIRFLRALVSMVLAAIAAMLISTAPAYALEESTETVAESTPIVEVVENDSTDKSAETVVQTPADSGTSDTDASEVSSAPEIESQAPVAQAEACSAATSSVSTAEDASERTTSDALDASEASKQNNNTAEDATQVNEPASTETETLVSDAASNDASQQAAADAVGNSEPAQTVQVPAMTTASTTAVTAKKTLAAPRAAAAEPKYNVSEDGVMTVNEGAEITQEDIVDSIKQILVLKSVTFNNVSFAAKEGSAVKLIADTTIYIKGICEFIGAVNGSGIEVPEQYTLTLLAGDEGAKVTAIGNAGKDFQYDAGKKDAPSKEDAESLELQASDGSGASGIGGKVAGAISIGSFESPELEVSARGCGIHAAGIGSSNDNGGKPITIKNAYLNGVYGGCQNAIAQRSGGSDDIGLAKGSLEGGAAIGGGAKGQSTNVITIEGCRGKDIVGGSKSAGIGGSSWSTDVVVRIKDSDLSVQGGLTGAAIGASRANGDVRLVSVEITDCNNGKSIRAIGGSAGAGIGIGVNGSNHNLKDMQATITIANSDVAAYGGYGAAGIGAGYKAYNVSVNLVDGSKVNAIAGPAWGLQYDKDKYLDGTNVQGSIGKSGAAAIGRGAWGSSPDFTNPNMGEESGTLVIEKDVLLNAFSSGDNWAIAGFDFDNSNIDASVLMARFSRNYSEIAKYTDEQAENCLFINAVDGSSMNVGNASWQRSIEFPDGSAFASKVAGERYLGYYSAAMTVADGGIYYLKNTSAEADYANRVKVQPDTAGAKYQTYASHQGASGLEEASADFAVAVSGISKFDMVAFRSDVDSSVPDYVEPEPEPTVDPQDDPTPTAPDTSDDAVIPSDDKPETIVPAGPIDPEVPMTDAVNDTVFDSEITPNASDTLISIVEDASELVADIPDAPVPLAAVVAGVPGVAAVPAVAAAVAGVAPVAGAVADDAVPMANGEEIRDEAVPMSAFEDEREDCWVHWWIMLGMILTTIYSCVVLARRQHKSNKLRKQDVDQMRGTREDLLDPVPVTSPAGKAVPRTSH